MARKKGSFVLAKGLRVFRMTYGSGATAGEAARWYVEFRWGGKPRRFPGFTDQGATVDFARALHRLVMAREANAPLDEDVRRWVEAVPEATRERLVGLGLVDPVNLAAGVLLADHVAAWGDTLRAKGNRASYAADRTAKVGRVFDACRLALWSDLSRPGVGSNVGRFLASLRDGTRPDERRITGATINKYVDALRSFGRWMVKDKRATGSPLADLEGVGDAAVDSRRDRRALTVDEMTRLLAAADAGPELYGVAGPDRARLYRFAYETGLRPGQIRSLTVGLFALTAEPATVTAAAAYVKRRTRHTQPLTPAMADTLRLAFANKMPAAAAFPMPPAARLADAFRADLAAARAAWVDEATGGAERVERVERGRSDFLAARDHHGLQAVFYSIRHTTGSVLAEAGVPQQTIRNMLHHTRSATTDRYMHTTRAALASAAASLPSIHPVHRSAAATGTGGQPAAEPEAARRGAKTSARFSARFADATPPELDKLGLDDGDAGAGCDSRKSENAAENAAFPGSVASIGLEPILREEMDFESIASANSAKRPSSARDSMPGTRPRGQGGRPPGPERFSRRDARRSERGRVVPADVRRADRLP